MDTCCCVLSRSWCSLKRQNAQFPDPDPTNKCKNNSFCCRKSRKSTETCLINIFYFGDSNLVTCLMKHELKTTLIDLIEIPRLDQFLLIRIFTDFPLFSNPLLLWSTTLSVTWDAALPGPAFWTRDARHLVTTLAPTSDAEYSWY